MAKKTLKSTKKRAWKVFSEMIRRNASDENGLCECVTCGTKKHWKEMQAGHFIEGRGNSILFHEMCVHPQCFGCNMGRQGNTVEYFRFMQKRYGDEVIDMLRILKHQPKKYTVDELEDLITIWRARTNENRRRTSFR